MLAANPEQVRFKHCRLPHQVNIIYIVRSLWPSSLTIAAGSAAGAAPIATDSQDANPAVSTGSIGQNGEPAISAGLRQPAVQAQNNSQERQSSGLVLTVARFVRENRLLVIGASLAVLAMVWGAATFASQRRR